MSVSRRRRVEAGYIYHVLNRGVQRRKLFRDASEYAAFEDLIEEIYPQCPLSILTYELMPNHWHFVVRPESDYQVSEFFQLLAGTHAKRFHIARKTVGEGHVYQDRFRSFPIQSDGHLLTVCRYVERNALNAGLVARAEDWRWSGLWRRLRRLDSWLVNEWPVRRPDDWTERVNQALTANELGAVRRSIRRGRPFGDTGWSDETARRLGLPHTLNRTGRPLLFSRA